MIDLSTLNLSLAKVTFVMDTLTKIKETAREGMWVTSLDLSDAYHHIPMRPASQVYLCFQVGIRSFRYLVLPFGLMSSPWVFTQVMKQVKQWALARNMILFQYLDDWLNLDMLCRRLRISTDDLLCLCLELGLLVNHEKSELEPKQIIVFLVEQLDLTRATAFTTQVRMDRIQGLIMSALEHHGLRLFQAESLLGLLGATYPTVPLGRLHLRLLQMSVIVALRSGRTRVRWIVLDNLTLRHLRWWILDGIMSQGVPFRYPVPNITIFTDASLEGWGVVCQNRVFNEVDTRHPSHQLAGVADSFDSMSVASISSADMRFWYY